MIAVNDSSLADPDATIYVPLQFADCVETNSGFPANSIARARIEGGEPAKTGDRRPDERSP